MIQTLSMCTSDMYVFETFWCSTRFSEPSNYIHKIGAFWRDKKGQATSQELPEEVGECQDEAYLKTSEKDEAISPNPRMLGIIWMICETLLL